MNIAVRKPPREFRVGISKSIALKDCGSIALKPDEQVTFTTSHGGQYDVVRKDWGFYATPSMNVRLKKFGLSAALIVSDDHKYFVFLVESGKEPQFEKYLRDEKLTLVTWLNEETLTRMSKEYIR